MKLPLTREEFEDIVRDVTVKFGLPYSENMRVMAINYFHSLDRMTIDFEPDKLGAFLYTASSHDMTYNIGQEIHKRRQAEQAEANKTPLSVVEPV